MGTNLDIFLIDMLEYFLFYFAYALTLDDDEDNNRMLKRVCFQTDHDLLITFPKTHYSLL